jgi:hypothetical protein
LSLIFSIKIVNMAAFEEIFALKPSSSRVSPGQALSGVKILAILAPVYQQSQ